MDFLIFFHLEIRVVFIIINVSVGFLDCLIPKLLSPGKRDRRFSSDEETESKEGAMDH
jgi:hypothetical protein